MAYLFQLILQADLHLWNWDNGSSLISH